MSAHNLTGRTRYRAAKRLFRESVLVLQVEERVHYGGHYDHYDGMDSPGGTYVHWRDARVDDLEPAIHTLVT